MSLNWYERERYEQKVKGYKNYYFNLLHVVGGLDEMCWMRFGLIVFGLFKWRKFIH